MTQDKPRRADLNRLDPTRHEFDRVNATQNEPKRVRCQLKWHSSALQPSYRKITVTLIAIYQVFELKYLEI